MRDSSREFRQSEKAIEPVCVMKLREEVCCVGAELVFLWHVCFQKCNCSEDLCDVSVSIDGNSACLVHLPIFSHLSQLRPRAAGGTSPAFLERGACWCNRHPFAAEACTQSILDVFRRRTPLAQGGLVSRVHVHEKPRSLLKVAALLRQRHRTMYFESRIRC